LFLVCCIIIAGLIGIASVVPAAAELPVSAPSVQLAAEGGGGHHGPGLGEILSLWTLIPFAGILLSIALFPLFAPAWWHHQFPRVAAFWAIAFAIPFLIAHRGLALHEILHIYLIDYIPFIILLWSLYTVAGGILVRGTLRGSPLINTTMLVIGTVMASWVGTTGASMILIRPLLRANSWRRHKVHLVIFFIFLVSNIGGSLTPLGDPPLFLGFLHSVPFFWTLHLFPTGSFLVIPLLLIFYLMDSFYFRREEKVSTTKSAEPLRIDGLQNFIFLACIVGAVLGSGLWKAGTFHFLGVEMKVAFVMRDFVMVGIGLLSFRMTADVIHKDNEFTWFPIQEVAILFAGIFMTIIPALLILKAGEHGALGHLIRFTDTPAKYFWVSGSLSSFLDNAPTYLTFFNSALGGMYPGMAEPEAVAALIRENHIYLLAISCGAVFMGAVTYIGNAPNFMVKSIAEEMGVAMPSFFGYLVKWSIPLLMPFFVVVTLLFF